VGCAGRKRDAEPGPDCAGVAEVSGPPNQRKSITNFEQSLAEERPWTFIGMIAGDESLTAPHWLKNGGVRRTSLGGPTSTSTPRASSPASIIRSEGNLRCLGFR
jgi:hypothetical protein